MTYIEERSFKKKKGSGIKYYLCQTMRIGKATKKISVYLGSGSLSAIKLKKLERKKLPLLKQKIKTLRGSRAISESKYLNSLLDIKTKKSLERIRKLYVEDKNLLTHDEKRAIESDFLTDYAYQTTKIEGNTLSAREAELILKHGQVPRNKELRDVYGLQNIVTAWNYISNYKKDFNEKFIKEIHRLVMTNILENPGKYREIQVYLGRGRLTSKHIPPPPDWVSQEIKRLVKWVKENSKKVHPVVLACFAHHLFIAIHPFIDGNGRVGRLILHFLLHKNGYPPVNILNKEKINYIKCLEKARDGNLRPFADFISQHILSYKSYISEKIRKKRKRSK